MPKLASEIWMDAAALFAVQRPCDIVGEAALGAFVIGLAMVAARERYMERALSSRGCRRRVMGRM